MSPGATHFTIQQQTAPATYTSIYNIATRGSGELFVFGGFAGQSGGSYVAKLDPVSLNELWRTNFSVPSNQWSYFGAMGVQGQGDIFAVSSNVLIKVNPSSGALIAQATLPQLGSSEGGTGAVYNGFVVTDSGLIVLKSIERGTCSSDGPAALLCAARNNLGGNLLIVDPNSLKIIISVPLFQTSLGRLMLERRNNIDYIYIPGLTDIYRYTWDGVSLLLDTSWGPVSYAGGVNGSGVGLLGDYAVIQTNFLPSITPSKLIAVSILSSADVKTIQPFSGASSWVPSKGAFDASNSRAYVQDTNVGQVAALTLTSTGWVVNWIVENQAKGFLFVTGPPQARQVVMPSSSSLGDQMVWRDASTGNAVATSDIVASTATLDPIAPGFNGVVYYPSSATGKLVQLTPFGVGLSYYPVSPCRIVDTRNTATPNLPIGSPVAYKVNQGGPTFNYSAQGGNASGCGISADAKAVFFNFVAVNSAEPGFLRAWSYGTTIPTASVLNYANVNGLNIANGLVIPVCNPNTATCSSDLSLQADQATTQLVIDVVGYFK
ncbi:MAG: hypothetical protein H7Y37_12350 [Anaerolineae bacterium]|nr:hypothetical protein [Gloeobacterales cyanobacterium ES-bin-313]